MLVTLYYTKIDETTLKISSLIPSEDKDESNNEVPFFECEKKRIPEPEQIRGKTPELYYDTLQENFYYKYIDRPLTNDELLAEQNEKINLLLQMQMSSQGVI